MFSSLKIILVVSVFHLVKCSIDGISYINDRNRIGEENYKKGEDPCNPLYWYPQMRPSYCDEKAPEDPRPKLIPFPIPVPAPPPPPPPPPPPAAPPVPIGIPIAPSNPFIPVAGIAVPMPPPMPQPMYIPPPAFPIQPASCFMAQPPACSPAISQPAVPMPAMPPPAFAMPPPALPMPYLNPYPQYPMPYPMFVQPQPMIGMVPGINGMVSRDGAINIMPFSDVYADVLEKHRQKVVRKRLEKVLDDYDGRKQDSRRKFPLRRSESKRHVTRSPRDLSE